jgi:hypothetical protein
VPRALIHPRALQVASRGLEEPLAGLMGAQAVAKIVQQREVEPRIRQVEAQGIHPVHTAADGIGRLAIGEPFDGLHDHHEGQAPWGDFHGTSGGRIQIGEELIVIEGAELGA